MTATVRAKVGPVKARFGGKVTLSDLDPPNGYKISGEGSGGAAGFAKGGASVRLAEDGAATAPAPAEAAAPAPEPVAGATTQPPVIPSPRLPPFVWVSALVILVVLLL